LDPFYSPEDKYRPQFLHSHSDGYFNQSNLNRTHNQFDDDDSLTGGEDWISDREARTHSEQRVRQHQSHRHVSLGEEDLIGSNGSGRREYDSGMGNWEEERKYQTLGGEPKNGLGPNPWATKLKEEDAIVTSPTSSTTTPNSGRTNNSDEDPFR
jgi:hypothetical protein